MKKHFSPIELTHRSIDNLAAGIQESDALVEHTMRREQIIERYWDLARLTPADTNGSLTAQLQALESLH